MIDFNCFAKNFSTVNGMIVHEVWYYNFDYRLFGDVLSEMECALTEVSALSISRD
jgi:hypothetical protein